MTDLYRYAHDVLSGKICASKSVIAACQRSVNDLNNPDFPYYFDPQPGEKFIRFASKFKHVEGPLAGTPLNLLDWQTWVFGQILGWKRKDTHKRRFRTAHIEVPRGNGKSFMISVLTLWMMTLDNEAGPQVYVVATNSRQARIVFDKSKQIIQNEPALMRYLGVEVRAHEVRSHRNINGFKSEGTFKPLASDGNKLDGLNIHCAIIDELHAIKNQNTWDKISTGMGKRDNSLLVAITTAGYDLNSIGYIQTRYTQQVNSGEVQDDMFFGCAWSIDEGDDPYDPVSLQKANPCWASIQTDVPLNMQRRAALDATVRKAFHTLYLNQWLSNGDTWLDIASLRAGKKAIDLNQFEDVPCYVAIDMAVVDDMACVMKCFWKDDLLYVAPTYFLPEKTINDSTNPMYQRWAAEGWLISIPGPVIDHKFIMDHTNQLCSDYEVQTINVDRYCAQDIAERLDQEGWPVQYMPQGYQLSDPSKKLQGLILKSRVVYENPIFEWNAINTVCDYDWRNNLYIRKKDKSSKDKIDGIICAVMCLGSIELDGLAYDLGVYVPD